MKFLKEDGFYVGEKCNHILDNTIIDEITRRKALSIVFQNEMLSKERIGIEDAINLVYILFLAGNIDLHSDPGRLENLSYFEVDETTKKVSKLLVRNYAEGRDIPLHFPIEMISSFVELKALMLYNINVAPPNLVKEIRGRNLPLKPQQPLCNLKKLDISFSKMDDKEAILETKIFHLLPKLESVAFRLFTGRTETRYLRKVLGDLRSSCCACRMTLKRIDLSYTMCTQSELKTLLVEVVPSLPNLVHINMRDNKIESIQQIGESINRDRGINNSRLKCQSTLQNLDLSWNMVILKIKTNPKEKAGLMAILCAFKGLCNLGMNVNVKEYSSDIQYQLRMNHAGRRLVESLNDKFLSSSLLPIILERAFKKSQNIHPFQWRDERKKDPTGMYYLFRSGPILQTFLQHRLASNYHVGHNDCCETRSHKRRKIIESK